jgi:hypothetical protein
MIAGTPDAPKAHAPGLHPQPAWQRRLLGVGTLLAMCVYYLNYGGSFDEGDVQGGSTLTLPLRALAVAAIVIALAPFRLHAGSAMLCVGLYLASAVSMLLAIGPHGSLNDGFFVNTLLQLPVLIAFSASRWQIDHAKWLRFVCNVLALQVIADVVVWQTGASLWLSAAFVGGVGNPSSFGLLCSMGFAFCLFHPRAGRARWVRAALLALGAMMSQALFASLALAFVSVIWMALGWHRLLKGLAAAALTALAVLTFLVGTGGGDETSFIEHKLSAAGALIGLIEYDIESAASVSQRVEMHEQTFAAIEASPPRLLWGHLDGLPYWPMDSQLLTYLGSFGAPMLALFLALHLGWLLRAWRMRRADGGFTVVALGLFGLIFTTNRILDYFPVASLYFVLVAMVTRPARPLNDRPAASPGQSARESTQSSAPTPRPVVP